MKIKPIETVYKGYKFRSRLEARWAVFFDALGIEWEYEPEGYDLGGGVYYLPDFFLKNVSIRHGEKGIWAEVKPKQPTVSEDWKMQRLVIGTEKSGVILVGMPDQEKCKHFQYYFAKENHSNYCLCCDDDSCCSCREEIYFSQYREETKRNEYNGIDNNDRFYFHPQVKWDYWMMFMKCYQCGDIKIEFPKRNYYVCPSCGGESHPHHHELLKAVNAVRKARFEHGETI